MIKCIATDMDGTLLNSVQLVSKENIAAIQKAQAQGIEVVVATGRSYQEARLPLDEAGIQCPIICVNGAEIRSLEGKRISATPIDKETAKRIAQKLNDHDVYFEVYTNEGSFTHDTEKAVSIYLDITLSANPDANQEMAREKAERRVSGGRVGVIEDYNILFEKEEYVIYKFLAFCFDQERLDRAKKSLDDAADLAISSSGHENLEITHINAQKGIALESFVNAKGIALAETMAIGDNLNDVSMLERVGRSVAMGNASYYVKSLCDVITDTNQESGVGKAILEVLHD
jgi:Cof subfamily protein (haloacid dehalogenase superfamily)